MMDEAAKNLALDELIRRVILPYSLLSGLMLIVGLFIRYSVLPEIDTEHESEEMAASHAGKTRVYHFPYLVLGAFAIFFHVGTQVIAIDTIILYAESMGLDMVTAKFFPTYTLTATIIGYIIGIFCIPRFINQTYALRICVVTGMIFSLCVLFVPGEIMLGGKLVQVSICFLFLLGLPNALIYAGIWPLAIRNLGKFTKVGASLLVMGLVGNGILPLIYGKFADIYDRKQAYWVLIPCFIYLLYYAFHGHKITSWSKKKK
jgi:fucose permease